MAVYDVNGSLLITAYNTGGDSVSICYDKDGDAVMFPANYVKYANGTIEEVTTTQIGSITQVQAFLVYGGKYYSTDGSKITVQASDFTVESTTTIATGHGNGFQLGADNKGYISGWDDQKVYVINLDTVALDSTITLPTTGYTTVATDTANGYMYIFQRDTRPSTEAIYNLIKYDYVHGSIISTVQTTKQYAAMQSCDFYNNKIYMTYGLGTNVAPCGLDIYDTSGNLLAEYTLAIFASTETEGLFVDRSNGQILLSLYNKKVYRLT